MRRSSGATSITFVLAATVVASIVSQSSVSQSTLAAQPTSRAATPHEGREIFRFETFGDEQLWTDVLRMHEALATVSPNTALGAGLVVDVDALPPSIVDALKADDVDLDDPAVTAALLSLDAVVGVRATVSEDGAITRVGITCALCHSTVDDSFATGIGHRRDGWANTRLNVGALVALSPALDEATKAAFLTWGPGRYDPRHHIFDGEQIVVLNEPTVPVVIPPIYGLRGVGFETFTADGPISYWNSYVGVSQMGGHGTFVDPRIGVEIRQEPDLVTPRLRTLLAYQEGLRVPRPKPHTLDQRAVARGKHLFRGDAQCSTCHLGPNLTDVLSGPDKTTPFLHDPAEVGMDGTYAARSATGRYRTTPLRGLLQHAPYFHDGSAADLAAVVRHYDDLFDLGLTAAQQADLVEYLKSL